MSPPLGINRNPNFKEISKKKRKKILIEKHIKL